MDRDFRRFYVGLVKDIPSSLRSTQETITFWGGLALAVAALAVSGFKPDLAARLKMESVPNWLWVTVGVAALIYGLMKSNYSAFEKLERESAKRGDQVCELQRELSRRQNNKKIADRLLHFYQRGKHEVANLPVDPNDFEDVQQFRRAAFDWLTQLRSTMTDIMADSPILPHQLSAVTDFMAADIPDPTSIGYAYTSRPAVGVEKAMFAMRVKALGRIINDYLGQEILQD